MQTLPDLEAWAIFAHVLETGSFSRAADVLDISQATVSKAISRLERRLGTALLYRNSRRLSPTPAGEIARTRAIRMLDEAGAAESEASAQAIEPRGLVRVAAPMSFAARHLAPLLPAFLERYPDVRIDLSVSDRIVDVVAGGFDVAVMMSATGSASLHAHRLCAVNDLLVASPAYLKCSGRPAHPRDLDQHACLVYMGQVTSELWKFRHGSGATVDVSVRGILRSNDADTIVSALLTAQGLAVLPAFVVWEALARGDLVEVMPDWRIDPVDISLVTPSDALRPLRVTELLNHVAEQLAEAPWAMVESEMATSG
ncbi:LysR family transcriptional regulator [Burkholderia anthina]|uniref:LysR family transcriptional regulator n=1 Tax=Burkholderia anthina TaxID=179879 RepID=UPI00158B38DF|nr:LysR family transcriptional regulator [Burkholderia anthina]